jgi:hypothetical protein
VSLIAIANMEDHGVVDNPCHFHPRGYTSCAGCVMLTHTIEQSFIFFGFLVAGEEIESKLVDCTRVLTLASDFCSQTHLATTRTI